MALSLGLQEETSLAETSIHAQIDCASRIDAAQGSTQACLSITSLALRFEEELGNGLSAELQLDPFGTPYAPMRLRPRLGDVLIPSNQDTPLGLIDHYALRWQFRKNLSLSIEQVNGATMLPNSSGLALAARFQDSGWNQTALTALYHLPPFQGVDVRIMIGNGEGENGHNLNPQQFGGLEIEAFLLEGLFLKLGMTYDGNNVGSQQFQWVYGESPSSQGFATQRQVAVIGLNGERPGLRGLKFSIGWQKTAVSDLDKENSVLPSEQPFSEEQTFDVNNLLVESPDAAVHIHRTVKNISMSYRILAEYFVGLDYETRTINTDIVNAFQLCGRIAGGECLDPEDSRNELHQTSFTVGAGKDLVDENLRFSLEYNSSSYHKLYRFFNYRGDNQQKTRSMETINARISYNW